MDLAWGEIRELVWLKAQLVQGPIGHANHTRKLARTIKLPHTILEQSEEWFWLKHIVRNVDVRIGDLPLAQAADIGGIRVAKAHAAGIARGKI
jgi:hypothetical protein